MKAILKHGKWGGPYKEEEVPVKETVVPLKGTTLSGYGKALPTPFMVQYTGKWLRVKNVCYSNSGTLWVLANGKKTVVDIFHD